MKNKQGKSVTDRIEQDIEYAQHTANIKHRELLALKVLGAVDFAVEFGLITYKQWEQYIDKIFKMI